MKSRVINIVVTPDELTVLVTDEDGQELARLDAHNAAVTHAEHTLLALVMNNYREALTS